MAYPVEVDYAYDDVPSTLFDPTRDTDESRNPTWSHKDRLNRCTVSAALGSGAQGIVVASSGNHGASAAAYAARAGLRRVVLASAGAPPAVQSFLDAYGAVVLPVPEHERWSLMRQIVDRLGYHPVSNLTAAAHTGHAFDPEGYKTVAYEICAELGVPAQSGGRALRVSDAEMAAARAELAAGGLWAEVSSAASLAGLRQLAPPSGEGALVCVSTSSGFKDMDVGTNPLEPLSPPDWATVAGRLRAAGISLA